MNTLIYDISSFNLAIFGIGITIFTVIYSFIYNKKEYMKRLQMSSFQERLAQRLRQNIKLQKIMFKNKKKPIKQ